MTIDGLTTTRSAFGPQETTDRLKREIAAAGLTLFAEIDHAAGATEAGLDLRPTNLLIFGNARGGTPLMQQNQMIGLDLPLKALIWQDVAQACWITTPDPAWLATRYGIAAQTQPVVGKLSEVLQGLVENAAKGC